MTSGSIRNYEKGKCREIGFDRAADLPVEMVKERLSDLIALFNWRGSNVKSISQRLGL